MRQFQNLKRPTVLRGCEALQLLCPKTTILILPDHPFENITVIRAKASANRRSLYSEWWRLDGVLVAYGSTLTLIEVKG